MAYRLLILLISGFILLSSRQALQAQDTFGPICDGVTVTCPPTEAPTATPLPTSVPPTAVPPTAVPTALPRAGSTAATNILLLAGATFIISGVIAKLALSTKRPS